MPLYRIPAVSLTQDELLLVSRFILKTKDEQRAIIVAQANQTDDSNDLRTAYSVVNRLLGYNELVREFPN